MTITACECTTTYIHTGNYESMMCYCISQHQSLNLSHTTLYRSCRPSCFDQPLNLRGKEGLKFMVQGDLGSGNVVLKPREGEKPEEKVGFGMLEIHVMYI